MSPKKQTSNKQTNTNKHDSTATIFKDLIREYHQSRHPVVRPVVDCSSDTPLTKQNFKDSCDINNIVKRFTETGQLPPTSNKTPSYADVPEMDFHTAMNLSAEGKSAFERLPDAVKAHFDHDPEVFVEFALDPENGAQMAEMGLEPLFPVELAEGDAPEGAEGEAETAPQDPPEGE